MDNTFDSINLSDFGLSTPAENSNEIEKIRTSNQPPAAATQSSVLDNPNLFSTAYQGSDAQVPSLHNVSKGYDSDLITRYEGTSVYSPYMDPTVNRDAAAARNWGMWDAVTTGLSGMLDNAKSGGYEYLKGWTRAGRALINLDTTYLKASEDELAILAAEQNRVQIENPIFSAPGTENDIFSKHFVAEALQNAGFTFGTLAGFGAEMAIGAGVGKLALKLPSLFKAGMEAKSVTQAIETGSAVNAAMKEKALVESTRDMVQNGVLNSIKGKDSFDEALRVASNIPIIGTLAETGSMIRAENQARAAAGSIALTTSEVLKMGAGGLRRAFGEWNFAASEASIESGGQYGDLMDDYLKKFRDDPNNNGRDPNAAEYDKMRKLAVEGATKNFGTNVAVLAIMNKMVFGNMFRKIGVDGKYLNLLASEGEKYFTVLGKDKADKTIAKQYTRGYFGALAHARDIKKVFGTKALSRELGFDFVRGVGKFETMEGIQELIQEGTQVYLRNYYNKIYDGDVASWSDSFKEAVDSQLTKTGWKTFLQGAITGLITNPVSGGISSIAETVKTSKEHKEALRKTLEEYNQFLLNPDEVLKKPIESIKRQAGFNRAMVEAGASGAKYEYFNNRSSAIITHALNAKRMGTFDAFKTFLNAYGSDFSNEEFEQATGINVTDFGMNSPADFVGDLTKKLDRYADIYEKYNSDFGRYFSIETFADDPHAKQKHSIARAAMQDAIHTIAFNEAKSQDGIVRAADIIRTITEKNKSIGQASSSTFNNVTDHNTAEVQINILKNEIEILEEGTGTKSKETLDIIETKKRELAVLEEWNKESYDEIEDPENPTEKIKIPLNFSQVSQDKKDKLKSLLTEYYSIKNKQNNVKDPVMAREIENVLQDINDYQKLTRDSREYINAVNLLSDPKNTLSLMHSFQDARVGAFARLVHNEYKKIAEESGVFAEYIKNNPTNMEELLRIARSPVATLDSVTKIYDHIDNITKLTEKENEEREKKNEAAAKEAAALREQKLKELENLTRSLPVNVAEMNDAELVKYIEEHYNVNFDTETDLNTDLTREYVDVDGERQITHTFTEEDLKNYFGEEFDFQAITKAQFIQFATKVEQELYNQLNPQEEPEEQAAEQQEMVILQSRKLKNLINKEVLSKGKKGKIVSREGKGAPIYSIEFEDGTTQELGSDVPVDQQFTWVQNVVTGRFQLVDISDALLLSDFDGLELIDTSLTEAEKEITGINPDTVMIRDHSVEYIDESNIKIDGIPYTVTRDAEGEIESIKTPYKGGEYDLSMKAASMNPFGIDAQYLTLVKAFLDLQNKTVDELSEEELDAGIDLATDMTGESEVVSTNPGVQIKPNITYTDSQIEEEIEKIMDTEVPADIIEIFNNFITPKTKKNVSQEDKAKLFDWAVKAVEKLNKLDASNNAVFEAIDYLSKSIINPIAKKDGKQNPNKSSRQRKKGEKKAKTTKVTKKTRTKKSEPSVPKNDTSSSIEDAKQHVENVYDKMQKETAVQIEELLKGETINFFTDSSIVEAVDFSTYDVSRSTENLNTKIDTNPFDDPDLQNGLNCNIK